MIVCPSTVETYREQSTVTSKAVSEAEQSEDEDDTEVDAVVLDGSRLLVGSSVGLIGSSGGSDGSSGGSEGSSGGSDGSSGGPPPPQLITHGNVMPLGGGGLPPQPKTQGMVTPPKLGTGGAPHGGSIIGSGGNPTGNVGTPQTGPPIGTGTTVVEEADDSTTLVDCVAVVETHTSRSRMCPRLWSRIRPTVQ